MRTNLNNALNGLHRFAIYTFQMRDYLILIKTQGKSVLKCKYKNTRVLSLIKKLRTLR